VIESCEFFRLDRFELQDETAFSNDGKSFHALFIAEGSGTISWEGGEEALAPGQSWLVPAALSSYTVTPADSRMTLLCTTVP
jgi:mannose-6-phosphate isomerase